MRPLALALVLLLGGCAYVDQLTGTAENYYDSKVSAWFKTACSLNVGALGRVSTRQRDIVNAACPPATEPKVKP